MNKVGIDIGGTSTRVGFVNEKGELVDVQVFSSLINDIDAEVLKIKEIIDKQEAKFGKANVIGLASPGPLDLKKGMILEAPNLPGWRNKPLVGTFQKVFPDKTIKLDGDAKTAAYGQYLNMPKGTDSVFYVTISSGIGSGFVSEGKIFHGFKGVAGEIFNSMPIWKDGDDLASCGIEYFCSGNNIPKVLAKRGVKVANAAEAFAMKDSDPIVKEYFEEYKKRMASFFATAIDFLDPQYLLIGGSVADHNNDFFKEIFAYIPALTKNTDNGTTLGFAKDLENSTLKGAANL